MVDDSNYYLYIKFDGPAADDGKLDIAKAGKTLSALGRWKKKYKKEFLNDDIDLNFKLKKVEKNCTELQIAMEIINKVDMSGVAILGSAAAIMNLPGVKDFLKEVGSELGRQLNLKVFSKGKNLIESDLYAKDGKVYVRAVNTDGKAKEIEKRKLDFYRKSSQTLNGMYALEADKELRTRVGYHTPESGYHDTASITLNDKDAFIDEIDSDDFARRLSEPFEESSAIEAQVKGQFVDFHGLAHKYKFSFQVRRQQEDYGKQKILCIVEDSKISEILDLMKPENKKNVCIHGKATKDKEGKLDKIMIDWFNEDADYNPSQTTLL